MTLDLHGKTRPVRAGRLLRIRRRTPELRERAGLRGKARAHVLRWRAASESVKAC